MTRIHNIGHIHNANFVQTQFSTSHPQKQHFLENWKFTFLWKYSVCGLKVEISEYLIKLLYVTYSAYKYEVNRIKTHQIRATYFVAVFSTHCRRNNYVFFVFKKKWSFVSTLTGPFFFKKHPKFSKFNLFFFAIAKNFQKTP